MTNVFNNNFANVLLESVVSFRVETMFKEIEKYITKHFNKSDLLGIFLILIQHGWYMGMLEFLVWLII